LGRTLFEAKLLKTVLPQREHFGKEFISIEKNFS